MWISVTWTVIGLWMWSDDGIANLKAPQHHDSHRWSHSGSEDWSVYCWYDQSINQSINQSIKIHFLNKSKILQCITVYASAQKAAREALHSLNWPPIKLTSLYTNDQELCWLADAHDHVTFTIVKWRTTYQILNGSKYQTIRLFNIALTDWLT